MALWNRDRDRQLEGHRFAAWQSPVTLRLATPADAEALMRLADLETRPRPPGPHLIAERDGRVDAALSLSTDEMIANPFRRTAELRELLRCHAGGVCAAPEASPSPRLRPRPQLVAT